ncbi:MAG: hypothetical protein IJU23_01055 [Proteobacteria bacterium]|nr:hypothetical protein [Pseudomonadota bacterium]
MTLFKSNQTNKFSGPQIFILSVLVSLILLFVYSKNSIIYEMNDFSDENNFISITDAMFHGRVLYKDIFEHKGPFLFLVYGLIHVLGNSYFTVYLFEVIANALFVYFGTKIILLYDEEATRARILLYVLCLEFCLCTAASFMFGGTVEELYLWMSSYGLYVTLRSLKSGQYYLRKEIILMGLLCGALFWTKYSLLGFYSGLALYIIGWNIAQKNLARLGKTILLFLGGFAISSIPVMIYSLSTQSFSDMVNIYFIENVFNEHMTMSFEGRLSLLTIMFYKDVAAILLILSGLVFVIKKEQKNVKLLLISTIVPALLASCCLEVIFFYYPMPMLAFVPLGIVALKEFKIRHSVIAISLVVIMIMQFMGLVRYGGYIVYLEDKINPYLIKEYIRVIAKNAILLTLLYIAFSGKTGKMLLSSKGKGIILCASLVAICTLVGTKLRDPLYYIEQELPQKRFQNAISQVKDASILVYGITDMGFNLHGHTYPQVKYFCNLNLSEKDTISVQIDYIKNEVVDFIITPFEASEISGILSGTSYQLIDTSDRYVYLGHKYYFSLYQKQTNKSP